MPGWTRGISCPRCTQLVYRLEREAGHEDWVPKGSPLETDGAGAFVRCPRCKTRIAHRASADVPGFGYEISR